MPNMPCARARRTFGRLSSRPRTASSCMTSADGSPTSISTVATCCATGATNCWAWRSGLSLLFIDLDRFKMVNDTLGHDAGDNLLREMASRLRACLREGDMVVRLGGDEFVVLVEEVSDPAAVAHIARKILSALVVEFNL